MLSKFPSIRLALIAYGLAGLTALLLVFGYLMFTSEKRGLTQQAEEYLMGYAAEVQWSIVLSVERSQAQIEAIARSPYLLAPFENGINPSEIEGVRQYLDDHITTKGLFLEFLVIAPDGKVLISTQASQENTDKSNRTYYQEAQSGVYIQPIYHHLGWQKPVMTIALPLMNEEGETLGILSGHINAEQWDVYLSQAEGLGQSGVVYLVNDYNYFVTSPEGKPGYAFQQANYSPGVDVCLDGIISVGEYLDYREIPAVGAYLWLENLDMCLVAEMAESEALAPITELMNNIILTLIGMITLGGLAVILIANAISAPIKSLVQSAAVLGAGELSHQVQINSANEIGVLGDAFNRMADQLKKTFSQLSESEAKYRNIFENVQDVFYQTDGQGIVTEVSPSVERHLALKPAQVIGRHVNEFYFDTADYDALVEVMEHRGRVEDFEIRMRGKGGELRYISVTARLVFDDGGELVCTEGVLRDITARKGIELALHESGERLKLAVEGTGAGLWDWQVQTGEVVFNPRWAEIVGYTLEELQPISIQTWINLTHPDDLEVSNRLLEKCFAGENDNYICEARMRHKDGHWVWVLDRGKVVKWGADGAPLRMTGTHVDITAQVQARLDLQESEARYRSLFEVIADGIIVTDLNGVVQYANPAFSVISGVSPEDVANIDSWKLFGIDKASYDEIAPAARESISKGEVWRREATLKRPDGSIYDADLLASPMRDEEGQLTGLIISLRDITAQKELSRMKSRFISNISHELRTPLAIISLYSENLIEFYSRMDDEQRKKTLQEISIEASSLQTLIEDVLLFSRLDADASFNIKEIGLGEVLASVIKKEAAQNTGANIKFQVPEKEIYLYADPDLLRQVFRNLINNAIKFSPEKDDVLVKIFETDNAYIIEIEDHGIGIPKDELPYITDRFNRGKYAQQKEISGTGLGLSITNEIVEKHKGRLEIESEMDIGTTVRVILPREERQ
jgi:PAS domain S-box-containing protein